MTMFASHITPLIQSFIRYRKASDHWNEASYEPNLLLFDRYCIKNYPDNLELTQEMADGWCKQRDTETNNACRSRIYVVVSFIKYLRERGITSIKEPNLPRKEQRTYIPHAFTKDELKAFFHECDNLPACPSNDPVLSRKLTMPVFFRLLYSSGIRTNEARMLRTTDVNLEYGILDIQYSKGHDQHYIVIHDSMLALMRRYDEVIKNLYPNRTYFFPAKYDSFHKRG